jgi:ABC-2 type transport system permease protein
VIAVEALRQLRRLRTWLAFAGMGGLPVIVAIALRLNPPSGDDIRERTLYAVGTASGLNHALAGLAFMSPFLLVVVVAMFAGESVAGEAGWGTLRYLLIRPVARARLCAAKLGVAFGLATLATLSIVVAGLASGTIAFGWHGVVSPLGSPIPPAEGVLRLLAASAYVAWGMVPIVAFGFFLSTMTDASAGAIGGAIALSITSQILDGLSAFDWLQPYLPTHYWSEWSRLFFPAPLPGSFARGIVAHGLYGIEFAGLAFAHFRRKDVLS